MRKLSILCILALLFTCSAITAQYKTGTMVLGTDLHYSFEKNEDFSDIGESTKAMVDVSVGRFLTNSILLGGKIGFSYDESLAGYFNGNPINRIERIFTFGIFGKHYSNLYKNKLYFSPYIIVDYSQGRLDLSGYLGSDSDITKLSINIVPNFTWSATNYLDLDLSLGRIYYEEEEQKPESIVFYRDAVIKEKRSGFILSSSDVKIGVKFKF